MASAQADENSWTTFEKLLLIQSVYKHGDNWLAISRTMKQHPMVSHTAEFFTQKNCSTKYNTLVDPLKNEAEIEDEHKKRSGEYVNDKQRMPWTAKLARQLYHERILELRSLVTSTEQKFRTLVNEIDEIKSGKWDDKFAEMIKDEQKNKELEKKAEVSKTAEIPKEQTISDVNIKIEPSVVRPPAKVESELMDVDKNIITTAIIEKETVFNKSIEPQVTKVETKPLIEVDPLSTTEDMEIDIVPSPTLQANKDLLPQTPVTPIFDLVIDSSKGQNFQQVSTTVATDIEVRKDNTELPVEGSDMMDIDDEESIEKTSSVTALESTLEADVSKAEQDKKIVVSPNAESVIAEDTPQTIGGDIAMDIDEPSVEILLPEVADESIEKIHFVTSPTSIEEVDNIISEENITSKEQDESKSQPSKITDREEIDSKEAVKEQASEVTSKQSAVSTKEETTLDIIKSAESLSPNKPASETNPDKKEDISEVEEVKEDAIEEDVRAVELSTLPEENEEDKYSSKEKATPIPQTEFTGAATPIATVGTPSNAPPSTPGDLVAPTPTPQYDTAPTPSGETPDDRKLKTWQKLVNMILHEISNHRFASVFQNPIREQDAPGYYEIVKQPMDLRTLKKRLREGSIHDTNLFHRDLMLMFMNASVFNREETDIHQMALEMKEHVETQIAEFRRSEGSVGTHEPATRRKSMAIDAHEAPYFTSDRRNEGDRSVVTGSSLRGKFKDDSADQRPTKKTKRLSISSSKKSEKDNNI